MVNVVAFCNDLATVCSVHSENTSYPAIYFTRWGPGPQSKARYALSVRTYDSNFCFDIWRVTNADYLLTYFTYGAYVWTGRTGSAFRA